VIVPGMITLEQVTLIFPAGKGTAYRVPPGMIFIMPVSWWHVNSGSDWKRCTVLPSKKCNFICILD